MGIDVAAWWRPTALTYFDKLTKPGILALFEEIGGLELRMRYSGSKKHDLAASAERLFGGDVIIEPEIQERALLWLPDEMRFAAPESGEEPTSPDNSEHDLADMVNKEGGNEGDQSFAQAA